MRCSPVGYRDRICLYTQVGFSQLRALSPSGVCRPFDASADGLVVGEGGRCGTTQAPARCSARRRSDLRRPSWHRLVQRHRGQPARGRLRRPTARHAPGLRRRRMATKRRRFDRVSRNWHPAGRRRRGAQPENPLGGRGLANRAMCDRQREIHDWPPAHGSRGGRSDQNATGHARAGNCRPSANHTAKRHQTWPLSESPFFGAAAIAAVGFDEAAMCPGVRR